MESMRILPRRALRWPSRAISNHGLLECKFEKEVYHWNGTESVNNPRNLDSYRYTVAQDGTFENRKLFAHVTVRIADGK